MSQQLLTQGLQAGYGGKSNFSTSNRGGINLTVSHFENEGEVYHDEWVTGGGQELARSANGQSITRTYVGNTISEERLVELGITHEDIIRFLRRIILENGEKIRFDSDFERTEEDWKYTYKVTYKREDPFIINGIEEIYFKGESVFIHTFGISKLIES